MHDSTGRQRDRSPVNLRRTVRSEVNSRRVTLVISDVDGTLLNSGKSLTARNRAAVLNLAAHHIPFTIISSRPPFGLRMLVKPLDLRLPMAAFNGSALISPDLKVTEWRGLGYAAAQRVAACFEEACLDVWLFTEDHWYVKNPDRAYVATEARTVQAPPVVVDSFAPLFDRAAKLVGVSGDFERLGQIALQAKKAFGAVATVSRSEPHYLDVTAPRVDKGTAVAALARLCAVDPGGVVTIGDMDNDVPMFLRSGFSIAMRNGSARARQVADVVTGSNDADGFADAIERIILCANPGEHSIRQARDNGLRRFSKA